QITNEQEVAVLGKPEPGSRRRPEVSGLRLSPQELVRHEVGYDTGCWTVLHVVAFCDGSADADRVVHRALLPGAHGSGRRRRHWANNCPIMLHRARHAFQGTWTCTGRTGSHHALGSTTIAVIVQCEH